MTGTKIVLYRIDVCSFGNLCYREIKVGLATLFSKKMEDKKSSTELSYEEVGKIQLRVENALSALEETLDSIDQQNKHSQSDKHIDEDKKPGNSISSNQLIAERLDAIILRMKHIVER